MPFVLVKDHLMMCIQEEIGMYSLPTGIGTGPLAALDNIDSNLRDILKDI